MASYKQTTNRLGAINTINIRSYSWTAYFEGILNWTKVRSSISTWSQYKLYSLDRHHDLQGCRIRLARASTRYLIHQLPLEKYQYPLQLF